MATATALKTTIPGWGADLDPKNRPGVPREKMPQGRTEAFHMEPERQVPHVKVLVSTEHSGLTPVFGTSCPPKGLSGKIRELAFRYSEGRKSHWVLLLLADRVDVIESALANLVKGQSHNPLSEIGLGAELKHHGFKSRFGQNRADMRRWGQEALLAGGIIGATVLVARRALGRSQ